MKSATITRRRPQHGLSLLTFFVGCVIMPVAALADTSGASIPPPPAVGQTQPALPISKRPASISLPTSEGTSGALATTQLLSPPIIQWLLNNHASLVPLGIAGGLQGWLVTSNGKQQVVYVTPDGQHLVAGVMASVGGEDVTALQLNAMVLGHSPSITRDNEGVVPTPTSVSTPSASTVPHAPTPESQPGPSSSGPPASSKIPPQANASGAPGLMAPFAQTQSNAQPLNMTVDELQSAVSQTAYFTLGDAGKPDIIMLVDPSCPYCHASWTLLKPLVLEGKIDVSVILDDVLAGSHDKAIDLLANPHVGEAWLNGQGSQEGVTVVAPPASTNLSTANTYLNANEGFARIFYPNADDTKTPTVLWVSRKSDGTPYTVYEGVGMAGVAGFLTDVENSHVATFSR